jgi:D-alanyl-D-alanine carboxypeptidase
MKQTEPVEGILAEVWPGAEAGLGLFSRPLTCGGIYWSHGGDILGSMTRNGFTEDGRRSVVVSVPTERSDSIEARLAQEKAAGDLVDRALCR